MSDTPGADATRDVGLDASPTPSDVFQVHAVGGHVGVRARDLRIAEGIHIDALDIHYPDVEIASDEPLPLLGDLKARRGHLSYLRFSVREDAVARLLNSTTRDERIRVKLMPGGITMYAESQRPGDDVRRILRAAIDDEANGFTLTFFDFRVFGTITEPPVSVVSRWIQSFSERFVTARGAGSVTVHPHAALLGAWLPAAGWKIPSSDRLEYFRVAPAGDRVYFTTSETSEGSAPEESVSNLAAFEVSEASRLFTDAEAKLAAGDLDAAAALYKKHAGSHPFAARRLLWIYASQPEHHDQAHELVEQLLNRNAKDPIAINVQGCLALADKDIETAAECWERLSERAVDEGDLLARVYADQALGELLCEIQPDIAAQSLESALALDPQNTSALRTLAAANARRQDWDKSVEALRVLLERAPDALEVRLDLADTLLEQLEQPDDALREYRTALEHSARNPRALAGVAQATAARGDAPAAIKAYDRVIETTDDDHVAADAHAQIGRLWELALGRPENAVLRYEKALELNPAHRQALEWLWSIRRENAEDDLIAFVELSKQFANTLLRIGERQQAAEVHAEAAQRLFDAGEDPDTVAALYRAALMANPSHRGALTALADFYEQRGEQTAFAQSLAQAAEAAVDPPVRAGLLVRLAETLDAVGKEQEAQTALEEAAAIALGKPEGTEALELLSEIAARHGEQTQALARVWEMAAPSNARARLAMRIARSAAAESELPSEARSAAIEDWYRRVVDEDPGSVDAQEGLALSAQEKGDYEEALARYQHAAEHAEDPERRALLLVAAARVVLDELSDRTLARELADDALAADSECTDAHELLGRVQWAEGAWVSAADHFEQVAKGRLDALPNEEAIVLMRTLADAHTHAEQLEEALAWRQRIAEAEPDDAENLHAAAALAESLGSWELAVRFRSMLLQNADGTQAADQLDRLADICRERLQDPKRAAELRRRALQAEPTMERYVAVHAALSETAQWESVFAAYDDMCTRLDISDIEHHRSLARVAIEMLGSEERAALAYERVLELDPEALDALEFLGRHYRDVENWRRASEVLVALAGVQRSAPAAVRAEITVARAETAMQLEMFAQAADLFGEAAGLNPSRSLLEQRRRLLQDLGRWPEVVDTLEAESNLSTEPKEKTNALVEASRIASGRMNDARRAIELLKEALEIDATFLPALDGLEGLYAHTGHAEGLVAVLRQKAGLLRDRTRRAQLLKKAARVAWEQLQDIDESEAILAEARELVPDDPEALELLESIYRNSNRHKEAAELMIARAAQGEEGERSQLLFDAARILAEQAGDIDAAVEQLEAAAALAPNDERVTGQLLELLERNGEHERIAEILEERAQSTTGEEQLRWWRMLARHRRRSMQDPSGAVEAYQRALDLAVDDNEQPTESYEPLFAGLIEALLVSERPRDAAAALMTRAERTADARLQRELLQRAAYTYQFHARDSVAASKVIARLLELNPTDTEARRSLATLQEDQGNLTEAAETLAPLTEGMPTDSPVVKHYVQVLERADRIEDIFRFLGDRARVDDDAAWALLAEVAERQDCWRDLAELYENTASGLPDRQAAQHLLVAATIYRGRVADMEASAACCRQAIAMAGNDGEIRAEAMLGLEDAGDYEAVYRVSVDSAEQAEPETRVRLLRRAAEVAETLLGDKRRALGCWMSILDTAPEDGEAMEATRRLYSELEDWDGLASVLRTFAERETGAEASGLWMELAGLYRDLLSNVTAAAEAMRNALEAQPADEDVRQQLFEALAQAGEFEELARRIDARLESISGTERIPWLRQLADLQYQQLQNAPAAAEALWELVELEPEDSQAASTLHEVLTREGRWDEVARLHALAARQLEAQGDLTPEQLEEVHARRGSAATVFLTRLQDPLQACNVLAEGFDGVDPDGALVAGILQATEADADALLAALYERAIEHPAFESKRAELLHELGRIAREKLADPPGAIDAYRRAYELDPSDRTAFEQLRELYQLTGQWQPLANLYEAAAERTGDESQRAELLIELGTLRGQRLSDPEGALRALEEAASADPDNERALGALESLHRSTDNWGELGKLYMARAARAQAAGEKVRLFLQAGDLFDGALQDVEEALRAYRAAYEVAEDKAPVLDRMEELLRRAQDHGRLAEVLALRATESRDPQQALKALMEMADLQLSQNDLAGATETLTRARDRNPSAREPLARLRRIKRQQEDWLGLDALLAEEESMAPAGKEAGKLARERGLLARDVLGEERTARDHFRRALELDPNNAQTAADLAEIAERLGDRSAAAFALERMATAKDTSIDRYQALLRAADHVSQLGDLDRLAAVLEKAIEVDPAKLTAWDRLAHLEEAQEHWEEARILLAELLARASQAGETRRTIDVYYRLGRAERRLDLLERAISRMDKVLLADANHRGALDELIQALRARGDYRRLTEALLKAADLSEDTEVIAELMREVGQIFDRDLGQPDAAFKAYKRAVDADPEEISSLRRLADLAFDLKRYKDFVAAYELLSGRETAPARALSLAWRAGESFRRLDEPEKATVQYERALELDATHYPSYIALGKLREQAQDYERAVAALDGALRTLPEDEVERAAALHERRGDLFAEHLGKPEEAAAAYQKALEQSPGDTSIRLKLAGVFAHAEGRTNDAMREYQRLLADDPFRLECYRALAEIYVQSQSLDRAFGMYSIIALLDPGDSSANKFLEANQARIQQGLEQGLMKPLTPADRDELVVHADARGPLRILVKLAPRLLRVWKPKSITENARELTLDHPIPLVQRVETLRTRLGIESLGLWLRPASVEAKRASVADLIQVTSGDPPPLMIDETLRSALADPRAVYFMIGKLLERLRGGHELFCRMKGTDLIQLTQLLVRLVDPEAPVQGIDKKEATSRLSTLKKLVPRSMRKEVEHAATQLAKNPPEPIKWVRALQHGENRVGLLVCADVVQAARALLALDPALAEQDLAKTPNPAALIRRSPAVVELLRFAGSNHYFELRRRTGLSLDDRLRGR